MVMMMMTVMDGWSKCEMKKRKNKDRLIVLLVKVITFYLQFMRSAFCNYELLLL